MSDTLTPVSWHMLQAQARAVIAKAISHPGSVDPQAYERALEVMRLPQFTEKPHAAEDGPKA